MVSFEAASTVGNSYHRQTLQYEENGGGIVMMIPHVIVVCLNDLSSYPL